jgi:hypothetical protein
MGWLVKKYFLLTDDQISDVFDNCRNIGVCAAIFAAAKWEYGNISPIATGLFSFDTYIFGLLIIVGWWLFMVTQLQAYRKLIKYGFGGIKLVVSYGIYNFTVISLLISVFIH